MLEVKEINKSFGGLKAVNNVSFSVKKGEIKTLIGPNGAGKTTMFNLIAGNLPPTSGNVAFKSEVITGLKPYKIARKGIIRTFQNINLFQHDDFTVLDNLLVGYDLQLKTSMLAGGVAFVRTRREEKDACRKANEIAELIGLSEWLNRPVSELTTGLMRLLELGRALMANPKLLLLDEPAAGLNDSETKQLVQVLYNIRDMGYTLLLVEHHMELVMDVSDSIVVMNNGQKIAEGNAQEISNHPEVIKAYLGEDDF